MSNQVPRSELLPLIDDRKLELILLPTEQCNFRCTYCYEDFAIGRMRPDTISGVKRLIERRAGDVRRLRLSWFGGEPLVAKNVVLDISRHASQLASQRSDLHYSAMMTTNGYLLNEETCAELVSLGVSNFQISLDGWGAGHDATRRRADDGQTFDRIWRNLLSIRRSSHQVGVTVRVHLQPDNVDSVRELTRHLIDEFAADLRFDLFFKSVGNWGGPNSALIRTLSKKDGAELKDELVAQWRRAQPVPPTVSAEAESAHSVCYAAKPNSLMIRADGRVGKCTVMLTDPRNEIGKLRRDGTIELHPGRLAPWIRGLQSADALELGCPAANLPTAVQGLLAVR